jgi:membrane-bound ClpP family serine protease
MKSQHQEQGGSAFHQSRALVRSPNMLNFLNMIRLDYLSCILTLLATVLIGKKLWQGWVVAGINSAVVCVIGVRTAQFGFVPANLLCIALYTSNLVNWRPKKLDQ